MCTGDNNCTDTSLIVIPPGQDGAPGINGSDGADGVDGQDGIFGGFSAEWKFDATTGVGAATSYLKFDSTILSTVSTIEVNKLNIATDDHTNFLTTFINEVDSVNYFGLVRVWKEFDSNTFWMGRITDASDLGASYMFTVEHIESNGTFAADDEVILNFTPNGAVGEFPGTNVIFSDHTLHQTSNIAETNFVTYTVLPNDLVDIGDQLDVQVVYTRQGAVKSSESAFLRINSNNITYNGGPIIMGPGVVQLLVNYTLTRKLSDQVYLHMKAFYINSTGSLVAAAGNTKPLGFANLNSHTLEFSGSVGNVSNSISLREVVIRKFEG